MTGRAVAARVDQNDGISGITERLSGWPLPRLAERLSAACYGTVLVLAALPLIHPDDVTSGWGWELVTGVGVATWLAHLFAEVVGDHVRLRAPLDGVEVRRAMVDGLPILLAAVLPALVLLLGRLDVLAPRTALWVSVAVAVGQLAGVGALVGAQVSTGGVGQRVWVYALGTAVIGLAVVTIKLVLGH